MPSVCPTGFLFTFILLFGSNRVPSDLSGMFSFNMLADLTAGTTAFVNYDADRIVFHRESDDREMIGVVSVILLICYLYQCMRFDSTVLP